MQRQDPQSGVQQPLDQQPVGPLDRDQRHLVAHECATQRPQPGLVVRERGSQDLHARLVGDEHIVLLGRPVDARIDTSRQNFNSSLGQVVFTAPRPRGTVADAYRQALNTGLRPVSVAMKSCRVAGGNLTRRPPQIRT